MRNLHHNRQKKERVYIFLLSFLPLFPPLPYKKKFIETFFSFIAYPFPPPKPIKY